MYEEMFRLHNFCSWYCTHVYIIKCYSIIIRFRSKLRVYFKKKKHLEAHKNEHYALFDRFKNNAHLHIFYKLELRTSGPNPINIIREEFDSRLELTNQISHVTDFSFNDWSIPA